MAFDYLDGVDETERFLNKIEIINDILIKLHSKDRDLLLSTSKDDLHYKFAPEWHNHIRNFYMLHRVDNPLTCGLGVDGVVIEIVESVWDALQHSSKPDYA